MITFVILNFVQDHHAKVTEFEKYSYLKHAVAKLFQLLADRYLPIAG